MIILLTILLFLVVCSCLILAWRTARAYYSCPPHTYVLAEIANERKRQIGKGRTYAHDDSHDHSEMPRAAAVCALAESVHCDEVAHLIDPWGVRVHSRSYRENLVRATALLVAEIERLDRSKRSN